MGIRSRKDYINKIKDFPIWKLINLSHIVEHRLFQGVAQGTPANKRFMRNLRLRRNIIREILLDKLVLWKKGELGDGGKTQFSDTQENIEQETMELTCS